MLKNVFIFLTIPLFLACNSVNPNDEVDEGYVEDNTYHSDEIGWSIIIPLGWDVAKKEVMVENVNKGAQTAKYLGVEVDASGLKHLINFRKDDFNVFQATSEVFSESYDGEWEINNLNIRDFLYEMYNSKGIAIDTSSSDKIIDGLQFRVFHITVLNPEGEKIFYQDMYSLYRNGFDFNATMTYNNEESKTVMEKALFHSKFD